SYHTLVTLNELDAPNFNDSLYSVCSFINAFNSNLIEAVRPGNTLCIEETINSWLGEKNKIPGHRKIPRKPHPIGQEWKTVADKYGSTAAYILRLIRPWFGSRRTIVGDSWFGSPKLCLLLMESGLYSIFHVKKRRGWPLNYPQDMIQKLGNIYGSYFSKVAVVNSMHLIAASLKDRKPQCIIATASTTTQDNEVEHIVKKCNNSSLVKFARPKIFSEYSSLKGA
ncbi:44045_t:CDS:2, partial [Gigaspora margarita]